MSSIELRKEEAADSPASYLVWRGEEESGEAEAGARSIYGNLNIEMYYGRIFSDWGN